MLELQMAEGPELRCPSIGSVDPGEVLAIVVTAVAANAFTYGAILQFHGVVTPTTTLLLVGGGAVALAATCWLVVLSFVNRVVGR